MQMCKIQINLEIHETQYSNSNSKLSRGVTKLVGFRVMGKLRLVNLQNQSLRKKCLNSEFSLARIWTKFNIQSEFRRSDPPESFQSIQQNVKCEIIKITLRLGRSPANLLHIFRRPFYENTSGQQPDVGIYKPEKILNSNTLKTVSSISQRLLTRILQTMIKYFV